MDKDKIFRDPIYGYIGISSQICKLFIDTPIFQRLRRIEQTSSRVIYPSAHHDRFSHSIGVFHLGHLAFKYIQLNSSEYFSDFEKDELKKLRISFEIACLMHDCGHAPFSHLFENHYLMHKEPEIKDKFVKFFVEDANFSTEYSNATPAAHEKVSALIILEEFQKQIRDSDADPLLIARMIMGCKYLNPQTRWQQLSNNFISLLNGTGFDVDSLDYIQRDTWATGFNNVSIDYQRLLSNLMIKPAARGPSRIVLKKQALSVLENIVLGRNFLYKWVYAHHKVLYEQYLLKESIEEINKNSNSDFCKKLFSIDTFYNPVSYNDQSFYLPTDDDIMCIYKRSIKVTGKIDELLSRNYRLKALWKTHFEFKSIFGNKKDYLIQAKLNEFLKNYEKDEFLVLDAKPKLKSLENNTIFIDINDKQIDASKAISFSPKPLRYPILYVTDDLLNRRKEIIKELTS